MDLIQLPKPTFRRIASTCSRAPFRLEQRCMCSVHTQNNVLLGRHRGPGPLGRPRGDVQRPPAPVAFVRFAAGSWWLVQADCILYTVKYGLGGWQAPLGQAALSLDDLRASPGRSPFHPSWGGFFGSMCKSGVCDIVTLSSLGRSRGCATPAKPVLLIRRLVKSCEVAPSPTMFGRKWDFLGMAFFLTWYSLPSIHCPSRPAGSLWGCFLEDDRET